MKDNGFPLLEEAEKRELYVQIQTMSLHKIEQPELNSNFQSVPLQKEQSVKGHN
jgi:hypothetical protein